MKDLVDRFTGSAPAVQQAKKDMGRRDYNRPPPHANSLRGLTIQQICDKFEVGRSVATRWRKERGLTAPAGNRGGPQSRLDSETIALMRKLEDDGVPRIEIAHRLGVVPSTVTKYLGRKY